MSNYINALSIYGLMNRFCCIRDDHSYWKTKSNSKLVICKDYEDIYVDNVKEINYMYLDNPLNIKGESSMNQIRSLIDINLLPNNITRQYNKELYETIHKWKNKVIVKEGYEYLLGHYDDIIDMIEKWRYELGYKYRWQEHAGIDKGFFMRCKSDQNFYNMFVILFYEYDDIIVGYSVMPNNCQINEDGLYEVSYMLRKTLDKVNDNKLRNITEYIDWHTFITYMQKFDKDTLVINWGCSTGGLEWYKTHKFPLYKLDKKYFYKKKI